MARRAQAVIEFMITYGWAILSVLVVVSALAYFGLFNTSKYVNDECNFGDQLRCEDSVLMQDGWLSMQLRNNFGVPIDIKAFVVKSDYGTADCTINWIYQDLGNTPVTANPNSIEPGSLFEASCKMASGLASNTKLRARPIIQFQKSGAGNPVHNQTGDVTSTVTGLGSCTDNARNCHGVPASGGGCEKGIDSGTPPC